MGYVVEELLEEFAQSKFKGPIDYSLQYNHLESSFHLLTICAAHGDEAGSLPSALKYFKAFAKGETSFKGQWTLVWGNPEASKLRQRFVEQDLNRMYGRLSDSSLEGKRALEISQIIKQAHLFIDFHQTIVPTLVPFFSLISHKSCLDLARSLGRINVLLSKPALNLSKKAKGTNQNESIKTQNDFASLYDIPSLTVEIGVKGFNKSSEILADYLFDRLLEIVSYYPIGSPYVNTKLKDILSKCSKEKPALSEFECLYSQPFVDPKMKLKEGWKNFAPLKKDEVVGYQNGKELLSPENGVIVFPKYPERNEQGEAKDPRPEYLYLLANVKS